MLTEKKILDSERNEVYVKSTSGDVLTGTVVQNKDAFDKFPQLIMRKYNSLVDELSALGVDSIIVDLSDRYTKEGTDTRIEEETESLVSNVTIDTETGVITVTKKNGTVTSVDTALEKVPASFDFVQDVENDKYYIKVTNVDGTTSQTEVTNLMNAYTFIEGDIISFNTTKSGTTTVVTASVKNGSIGIDQLSTTVKEYFDNLKNEVTADRTIVLNARDEVLDASASVTANTQLVLEAKTVAVDSAKTAKSYAVGGTQSRPNEDQDNAQYYASRANVAKVSAETAQAGAEQARDEAEEIVNSAMSGVASVNGRTGVVKILHSDVVDPLKKALNTVPLSDTPTAWIGLESCVIRYDDTSTVITKPTDNGTLFNLTTATECQQIWIASNGMWQRSGNETFSNWKKNVDEDDLKTVSDKVTTLESDVEISQETIDAFVALGFDPEGGGTD